MKSQQITMYELDTLQGIGAAKTPGEDGFPAVFYQRYWDLCCLEVNVFIANCFAKSSIPNWFAHLGAKA